MLKAVIVDDEPKAIQSFSWELSNFNKEIEVVATFSEPEKALLYLKDTEIDCLFLDIEMPTMDGFQLLEKLERKDFAVVFTTAYNEYAIKALKNEAIDYLLKPIDAEDLEKAIEKIKKHRLRNFNPEKFERFLLEFNENKTHKKITISTDGKLLFLEQDDILFAVSDGNYSTLHLQNNKKIVLTKQLKEVSKILPEKAFFRIHNSYIINLNKIKEFIKTDGYVILENNHKIPVSRQRKSELLEKF
ncbi:LytTR family two component transcriptional regulator [Lutibacter sp. Hel_I_33_5]|uniref:LytR/AlgR family response regulator transcription factor n=1 Tax=Lutibacter sp. Hel_I_33_5 TaxID=1566289 RepID=UPI0011A6A149|nr:LytTR family DNA-binding domain-containing protein [Lutibacter sp. Hel_I_33_5]TVZ56294.1 LytTR family two component transcriptional regulator [Lutibacter sp. Hel_I_33_5]